MSELRMLAHKTVKTYKEAGAKKVVKKATVKLLRHLVNGEMVDGSPNKTFADVLFINGCYLPHPSRYRVAHQMEQLEAANISSNTIFYTDVTPELARLYRVFVFFRCPYTEQVGKLIERAKEDNKVVLFDIDDLVIDREYTKSIQYLNKMSDQEKQEYYNGIDLTQKTLKMCDAAITTTERMAEELSKYVPQVFINRNVASDEMLKLSLDAQKNKGKQENSLTLGYFSGSITHDADFMLILPVIKKLMIKYCNLKLALVGEITVPKELEDVKDRIIFHKFGDWKELPKKIASVDINLAPLENSIFNEAKSENKWVEAALVRVPTVASKVGAFEHMIENGVTGMLCDNIQEWENALERLITDKQYRKKIADNAFDYCKENCTSVYSAQRLGNYIKQIMKPNIAFILPVLQISGGALVILKHCVMLKEAGYDVTIINQGNEEDEYVYKDGARINVISYKQNPIIAHLDKAVATLWSTVDFFDVFSKIGKRYYNVQNFETDFYEAGDYLKIKANRTYNSSLNMKYITISKWCQKWLLEKYGKESQYAPNGLYVDRFYPVERKFDRDKIRILVEGNSDDYYKNVDESFKIIDLLDKDKYEIWFMSYQGKPKENYRVDKFMHQVPYEKVPNVYRECDILLKSSLLESFSYPPLEMMATGGFVVVAPNDGNVEYLEDGKNCLFYNHDNLNSAKEAIEKIVNDVALRRTLTENARKTAEQRDWKKVKTDILSLYDIE